MTPLRPETERTSFEADNVIVLDQRRSENTDRFQSVEDLIERLSSDAQFMQRYSA